MKVKTSVEALITVLWSATSDNALRKFYGAISVPPEALERVKGIEPSYAAWEAAVLPLNYTRDTGGSYAIVQRASVFDRLT